MDGAGDALSGENIADLTHADHVHTGVLDGVQHSGGGRSQGKVPTVSGTGEVRILSREGAGDDTAHAVLTLQNLSCHTAVFVQLLHRNNILVGSDLEHAVRRSIDDQIARFHVLFSVVPDHLRAGIGLIAKHAAAGSLTELGEHFLRESVGIGGHRPLGHDAGEFPMARGGILAPGFLPQAHTHRFANGALTQPFHALDLAHTQMAHRIGTEGGSAGNTAEGIAIRHVTECLRIRCGTDTQGVQNDQKYPFDISHSASPPFSARSPSFE